MFESSEHTGSLSEEEFDEWLEKGRSARIGYEYMVVIWNQWENGIQRVYQENRSEVKQYIQRMDANETLIAVYDLYSESRMSFNI